MRGTCCTIGLLLLAIEPTVPSSYRLAALPVARLATPSLLVRSLLSRSVGNGCCCCCCCCWILTIVFVGIIHGLNIWWRKWHDGDASYRWDVDAARHLAPHRLPLSLASSHRPSWSSTSRRLSSSRPRHGRQIQKKTSSTFCGVSWTVPGVVANFYILQTPFRSGVPEGTSTASHSIPNRSLTYFTSRTHLESLILFSPPPKRINFSFLRRLDPKDWIGIRYQTRLLW